MRGRYPSREAYLHDLAANGLDEAEFAAALARELKVEATLEKVASRAAQVSDIDVELYYHYHPEQFRRPETRRRLRQRSSSPSTKVWRRIPALPPRPASRASPSVWPSTLNVSRSRP